MKLCTVEGCGRKHRSKGYCSTHYASHRWLGEECAVAGCDRHPRAAGLCTRHYEQKNDVCKHTDCLRPQRALGLCAYHYRLANPTVRHCRECGAEYTGDARSSFCSRECKRLSMKGPFRRAVETGDPAKVLAAARECSQVDDQGCWNWQFGFNRTTGYPVIGQGGTAGLVHRHVMVAALGRSIGSEPVHHKCANRRCVNPEHLQLTTHRENLAEMFARNAFLARIAALEAALAEVSPEHPLLT